MAATRGLPYSIFLKRSLHDIMEKGTIQKIKKKWEIKERSCKSMYQNGRSLSFEKTFTLFLLLIIGTILALLIMITEIVLPRIRNKIDSKDTHNIENIEDFKVILNEVQHNLDTSPSLDTKLLSQLQAMAERIKQI